MKNYLADYQASRWKNNYLVIKTQLFDDPGVIIKNNLKWISKTY
jgi:hypothetical protein